jgi:hypothetical protein
MTRNQRRFCKYTTPYFTYIYSLSNHFRALALDTDSRISMIDSFVFILVAARPGVVHLEVLRVEQV